MRSLLFAPIAIVTAPFILAQTPPQNAPTPPPVARPLSVPQQPAPAVAAQRVYSSGPETLVSPDAAQTVVNKFRSAYAAGGAPRVVVYVNRALVDTANGLELTGHTEQYEKNGDALKTSGTNTYQVGNVTVPTLADQQTVREVERLFGRVFRNGGAQLADQKTAAALLPENAGAHLTGDQAAKEREALSKIADIAIEVLISSRNLTVPQVSGDATYSVPDIQATAIRLKDAAIVGQAAASDVLGKDAQAGRVVQRFDVRDITEATAFALMEDMLTK